MPRRIYTPAEKRLVRRLLLIHNGNVPIVHHLTGFPRRTIHSWRKRWNDDYELYTDALAQNLISRANALAAAQKAAIQDAASDSAFAQIENRIAQFRQIRANLMNHATSLSHNLALNDGQIGQRVHALARLIDRLLMLDAFLGDSLPEQYPDINIDFGGGTQEPPNTDYLCESKDGGDPDPSEKDPSRLITGFTQASAGKPSVDLSDLLEERRRALQAETMPAEPEETLDSAPFEDNYGGIS